VRAAVVGAGIAGLRTAQLLERSGVDVTVFEARNRIGGRLWTTTVEGAEFEAGAEWFDAEHARVFGLMKELGLAPVPSDARPRRYHFCGHEVMRPEVAVSPDAKGESLADALDATAKTFTERAYLEAVALSDEGTDSDRVDLAEWTRFAENYSGRGEATEGMSVFRLPVPATELCERIAKTVKGDVCLNAEVNGVHDANGVSLSFTDGTSEVFDEAVLTLPPTCLEHLDYDGPLVWHGVGMTPTCKIALLFDRPFWEAQDWSGHLMSDLAIQQAWAHGNAIVCYINGRGMESIVKQPDPVESALESLEHVAPQARGHFVAGQLVDWRTDPYSGGGFPYVPPGSRRQSHSSSGPIRFAGDWTAQWMGFVEGALESAERVVEEMLK
jgi:monoamine oxidase